MSDTSTLIGYSGRTIGRVPWRSGGAQARPDHHRRRQLGDDVAEGSAIEEA